LHNEKRPRPDFLNMPKRFIDTGFLDQKWIRKLSPEKKIFLIYLMLKCDNGGIIDLDLEDASFWIGKKIERLDFLPENYLIPLNDCGKYFMPKFIEWQYKDLTSNKYIVAQARQILEKHGLINSDFTLNLDKIYVNVTKNVPESQEIGIGIGIGIGNGKGKKEEEPKIEFAEFVKMTLTEYNKLVEKYGEANTKIFIEILDNYKGSKGTKYKSDYRAILNWVIDRVKSDGKFIVRGGKTESERMLEELEKSDEVYKKMREEYPQDLKNRIGLKPLNEIR